MKHLWILTLAVLWSCAIAPAARAQSDNTTPGSAALNTSAVASATNSDENRSPAELFDDADHYANKKFEAFNKMKMPYDKQLDEKIRKEQRELAAKYAKTLSARKLETKDVYYLGLLYNLARDFDAAMDAMRRFLRDNPTASGEPAQNARAIIVIQAAKKGLLTEAEARLAEYATNQPQVPDDRYSLENWVTAGYFNAKDYEHALPHAQQMWTMAKLAVKDKSPFSRDATLNDAAVMLSEVYLKANKKDEALAVIRELRELALTFPSGNLYKLALRRTVQLDPQIDPFKNFEAAGVTVASAPEITANEWIDQAPVKLADLRGRVVLLDFWAPWCGPCRSTIPRFQKWHETYKDKGLVILGLTTYYGHAEGRQLTRVQELNYLRDFKKKFPFSYGVAVSDSEKNDLNYAVSSIPTTFLIDRRGVVRFISIGSSDLENAALGKMIKTLVEEPAPSAAASNAK